MFLSAAMAFVYRKYLRGRQLIILLPYLIFVFIQETSLTILTRIGYISSTAIVYNIYRPLSAIVFAFIYYRIPFMLPVRKLITSIVIIYICITLINYFFIESIFVTSSYLAVARGFVITLFAILFLFSYFNLDNTAEEKYWRPLIWITAGVTIFYPVISISITFQKFLAASNATLFSQKVYQLIPQVMSIFMYSCFSYAFYLCRKIK
jgi:hypothetical protein